MFLIIIFLLKTKFEHFNTLKLKSNKLEIKDFVIVLKFTIS